MDNSVTTYQNQNVQLTKTFIVAFAGMLLAIPIVTVITASIVKAQFGSLAYAQASQPEQSNSIGATCEAPVETSASTDTIPQSGIVSSWSGWKWTSPNQSNSSTITTTTTTTTNTDNSQANTTVDSRFSGNTISLTDNRNRDNSYTDNRFSGNTTTATIASNNNTAVNSGNTTTTSTTNTTNNVNTSVNSGNTTNNDNDFVDVL